ncbi:mitotic-spindle organizing protein 2A [Trichonephila clavipes]|nr:mitotic-spindle organizing protein 2A [Trichonephila clavipes]
MVAVLNQSEPLGGEGKIVEIDESMFGKMKYGKGKPMNGQWVFGGVERNSNKCIFRVVPSRMKEELLSVIKEWVVPGSVIISDCWKAYNCLSHEGYQHLRFNHSLTFKDPETGAHTNSIEGTLSAIKRSLRNHAAHVEGEFNHYLIEYMWRRRRGHSMDDVFRELLRAITTLYPPMEKDVPSHMTATAGSDVVQSGRPIFDGCFQHLWPYIGNNTANVVFQMVERLWLIRIDQ